MCFLFTTKETKPVLSIAVGMKKLNVVVRCVSLCANYQQHLKKDFSHSRVKRILIINYFFVYTGIKPCQIS
jgi:hypothetical protein